MRSDIVQLLLGVVVATSSSIALPAPIVSAVTNADGRYEIFTANVPGAIRHRWQVPGPVDWTAWTTNVDGQFTKMVVTPSASRRLFLFGLDGGELKIRSQTSPNGAWGAQTLRTGHDLKAIAAARNADGRLEAFAVEWIVAR